MILKEQAVIEQLESEVLECIDYSDVSEFLVDRLLMFSDQYARDYPDWGKTIKPSSDILENVYNQANKNDEPKYYLKPIGVSEDPILKADQRDFSALHQNLAFSKKGTGAIVAGDIVITTGVGCGCLLSYFQVTGHPYEATQAERESSPSINRWPWHIEGRNISQDYGAHWWKYNLDRKTLLEKYLASKNGIPVTKSGGFTLGTINFGSDKVEITKEFADYLIAQIKDVESQLE